MTGMGNMAILALGLIAWISPTAQGPCMYIPVWPAAKAVLPSA